MSTSGWVGFDLDGTLATYDNWKGIEHIGAPIPAVAKRLKRLLAAGVDCRVFTARVSGLPADADEARRHIQDWTERHFGVRLAVTNAKDFAMHALYDDRCVAVETNTGRILGGVEP
jgi:hypothetical protein